MRKEVGENKKNEFKISFRTVVSEKPKYKLTNGLNLKGAKYLNQLRFCHDYKPSLLDSTLKI